MKKVTKKEIKNLLSIYRKRFGVIFTKGELTAYDCGFYTKNGVVKSFVLYFNEGVEDTIYNRTYDKIIYLKEYTHSYGTLKECVDKAYDEVNEWLKEK